MSFENIDKWYQINKKKEEMEKEWIPLDAKKERKKKKVIERKDE